MNPEIEAQLLKRSNKEVSYYFKTGDGGVSLSFYLSMGLFSSNTIDVGTKHLLQELAEGNFVSGNMRVLDAGCGTGVIGIALKKAYPDIQVTASDRDALALAYTTVNSKKNGTAITVTSALDILNNPLEQLSGKTNFPTSGMQNAREVSAPFQLIVTNIPAKAGAPVLRMFFMRAIEHLTNHGLFAVVIVKPLEETAEEISREINASLVVKKRYPMHTVFIFKKNHRESIPVLNSASTEAPAAEGNPQDTSMQKPAITQKPVFPEPYLRNISTFSWDVTTWKQGVVFDIDGFDTLPFEVIPFCKHIHPAPQQKIQHIAIWNPGQGHTVCYTIKQLQKKHAGLKHITLAGRDLLALAISAWNIKKLAPTVSITTLHMSMLCEMNAAVVSPCEICIILPEPIPGYPIQDMISELDPDIVTQNGILLVGDTSTRMARLKTPLNGFSKPQAYKYKGFRADKANRLYS